MKKQISLTLALGIMLSMAVAFADTPGNTDTNYAYGNGYCHNQNGQPGKNCRQGNNPNCPYVNQANEK